MDVDLEKRYQILFLSYGLGQTEILHRLKQEIASWNEQHDNRLRPDAAYFLIVNFDHMVIRPYIGTIFRQDSFPSPFDLIPPRKGLSLGNLSEGCLNALNRILKEVEHLKEPISSHAILGSIDKIWQEISPYLLWA